MSSGASAPASSRAALAALCAAALIVVAFQLVILGKAGQLFADFHAFYCGGAAVLHRADPYAAASLGACEAQIQPFGLHHTANGVIAPVPFPGYAFVLFAPFALLPYVPAACLWLVFLLACAAYAAIALSRLTHVPLLLTGAMLAATLPVAAIGLGEVAPIALAALCASALFVRDERYWLSALCLCVAAVLPHVVIASFAAAFLFVPRMRVPLLACGAVLAVLAAGAIGVAANVEYFARVLPAHAQAEIGYIAQYGWTWILHGAGLNDAVALTAGKILYAGGCMLGIVCARVVSGRTGDRASIIAVPVLFAVALSPFMHFSEITLALPAVLLLFVYTRGSAHSLLAAAIVTLSIAWFWIVGEAVLALPVALASALVVSYVLLRSERVTLYAAFATVVYAALLLFVALAAGPQVQHPPGAAIASDLAQAAWARYIRGGEASTGIVWWIAKTPTWIALLISAACAYRCISQEELETVAVVDRMPLRA